MKKLIALSCAAVVIIPTVAIALLDTAKAPPPLEPKSTQSGELDAAKFARIGVRVEPATQSQSVPIANLPAQVTLPPEARVAVTSPFSGVITQVLVIQGQQVSRGTPLATVRAAEPLRFGAELARINADLPVLRASARRLDQLSREGIVAPARSDEARAALNRAEASAAEQSRLLAMAGAGAQGTVTLRAPISGRIAMTSAEAGQPVGNGAAPFVVENTSALRLDLQVPERLVRSIRLGMAIEVPLAAGSTAAGKILSLSPSIDPLTRSVTARASINADLALVPGKSVTAVVFDNSGQTGVSVPTTALARINGSDFVFVSDGKRFTRRQVTMTGEAGGRTFLGSGLRAGERIAVSGVAELKSVAAQ